MRRGRYPARGRGTGSALGHAVSALLALGALTVSRWASGQVPAVPPTPLPVPPAKAPQLVPKPPSPPASSTGVSRWFNPATAPFIPIPEIAADPDNGTTVGIIPTWLKTDENHDIRQIIAPDVIHNPYFGYGVHGRIYDYPSTDEQWSVIGGIKQRVERSIDGEYQTGRLRDQGCRALVRRWLCRRRLRQRGSGGVQRNRLWFLMALDPAILAGPALLSAKSVVFAESSATCGGGAPPCAWVRLISS